MLNKTVAWAPKDLEKGGTWLGINEHGLFAGLTNRYALHGYPDSDRLREVRGELPHLALRHATLQDAAQAIEAVVKERAYPGFHLVLAAYESALCLVWDGHSYKRQPVETSTFIVTERSFGETPPEREVLIREKVSALGTIDLDDLSEVLATHQDNSIDAVCVHLDGINYGTRSAVCINLMPSFGQSQLWETNVPPCRLSGPNYR